MSTTGTDLAAIVSGDTEWRRLDRRMLLIHPVIELGRAVPALAGLFVAGSAQGGAGSLWSLGAAGLVVVLGVLRWFTTRFRITDEQIQLHRGLLRRVTISARLDRVRTVDVTAHLLHRALGLAKVAIGTGISDRKGHHSRLVLDGLSAAAATQLRAELLHREGTVALDEPGVASAEEYIARLDPAWIRYAPFTLSGAIACLAVLGFGWRLISEAHLNIRHVGPLHAVEDQLRRTSLALDIVAVAVVVIAIVAVASTIGYALAFWGFRLSRNDGGSLHVTRGLITTRATSIEQRRLVGAEVSEPLLLRAVGGARCVAIATGLRVGRGAERGGEILLPPAPRTVALDVATEVLGTAEPATIRLARHPRAALRRRLVRVLAAAVAVVVVVGALVVLTPVTRSAWFASLALLVLAPPLAVDRYRSLGHAVCDGYLVTQFGSAIRRRIAITCTAVIGWNMTSSFFQRRAGVITLTATTAAGRQGYEVTDAAELDAIAFADSVTPGLLTQFSQ